MLDLLVKELSTDYLVIFSETNNGTHPMEVMEAIGWVFKNRVTMGFFNNWIDAVGSSQSALQGSDLVQGWLTELSGLNSMTETQVQDALLSALNKMSTSFVEKMPGWFKSMTAAENVLLRNTDPTAGATDFRHYRGEEEFIAGLKTANSNSTPSSLWYGYYHYKIIGPYRSSGAGPIDIWLIVDNRIYCSWATGVN